MMSLATRLNIPLSYAKNYLKVDHSDDDELITDLVAASIEQAEQYLNNPFLDSDGNEITIPATVKQWCLGAVGRAYERRVNGLQIESMNGLGSVQYQEQDFEALNRYRLIAGI